MPSSASARRNGKTASARRNAPSTSAKMHREPPVDRWLSDVCVESGGERSALRRFLLALLIRRPASAGQLQHCRVLALTKISNQHDLPVRELQRIMMRCRPIEIHLPETGNFVSRLPGGQEPERSIAFDLFLECKFRPGEQTDGYARLARIRETARDGIWKLCR